MKIRVLFAIALVGWTAQGFAQTQSQSNGEPPGITQSQPMALSDAPATAVNTEIWFEQGHKKLVRNVNQPSLTAFIPAPGTANGAAIIIAPGGGFLMLSMETEGYDVARWFAARGVTAFVLKYRLNKTDINAKGFSAQLGKMFVEASQKTLAIPAEAKADVLEALKTIRRDASKWNIDTGRVGLLGFSAGAFVSMAASVDASKAGYAPAFLGYIYGSLAQDTYPDDISANFPPVFIALAADDPLFSRKGFSLVNKLHAQKRPIEFHLYQKGGHGFGLGQASMTNANWPYAFWAWMQMNHWLAAH